MKMTLTGATGFLGSRLVEKVRGSGHELRVLGRKRSANLPAVVKFWAWDSMRGEPPVESLEGVDAVINLAGEPVAQRWNADVKQRIRASRVDGTRNLVAAISKCPRRPQVLVNASAIGIYGSRGDEILTEESAPGEGFLTEVVKGWEQAADGAAEFGVRVVKVRFGIVLGRDGGALAKMLPLFKLGVGGKLGSGKQWMSWVHIEDVVDLIRFALENPAIRGPVNTTAPSPVTNEQFARQLGATLHRPAILPVPAFAIKLMFGELASDILSSQRALPKAAQTAGYKFQFPELGAALRELLA